MKILFPIIHNNLTRSFCQVFRELGYEIIIPCYAATQKPPTGEMWIWNGDNSQKDLDNLYGKNVIAATSEQHVVDLSPDILFITTYENQFEILNNIAPRLPNSKVVAYSGNDYWDGALDFNRIKNYLPADMTGKVLAKKYNVNHIDYIPWVFYDEVFFSGANDSNNIGTYIGEYESLFPQDYAIYNRIRSEIQNSNFILHSKSKYSDCIKSMHSSFATLHVKRLEGHGFAIIESMACGRPVFMFKKYMANKALNKWSIEGVTSYSFNGITDLNEKISRLINDKSYRNSVQKNCASKIREIIDNDEQTNKLKIFLNELI